MGAYCEGQCKQKGSGEQAWTEKGDTKTSHALFSSGWVFLEGERVLVLPDCGPALCDHASVRLGGPAGVFKPMKE